MSLEMELKGAIHRVVENQMGKVRYELSRRCNEMIRDKVELKFTQLEACFAGEIKKEVKKQIHLCMYTPGEKGMEPQPEPENCILVGARAGVGWSDGEDEQLEKEIHQAIELIAIAHKRTNGAIRARLKKQAEERHMHSLV